MKNSYNYTTYLQKGKGVLNINNKFLRKSSLFMFNLLI